MGRAKAGFQFRLCLQPVLDSQSVGTTIAQPDFIAALADGFELLIASVDRKDWDQLRARLRAYADETARIADKRSRPLPPMPPV